MKLAMSALAVGFLCLATQPAAHAAAVVSYDTLVQNNPNWSSSGYADVGYVFPASKSSGFVTGTSNTISYAATSGGGGLLTSPITLELSPTLSWIGSSSITDSNYYTNMTFTFNTGSPTSVRVGVLVAAGKGTGTSTSVITVPGKIQLTATGGSSDSVTTTPPSSPEADWYFFDVTGITPGTTLTVASTRVSNANHEHFAPINGVVFSTLASVPTPAALPGGLALLGLAAVRRRRR